MRRFVMQVAFGVAAAAMFSHFPTFTVGALAYCLIAEAYEQRDRAARRTREGERDNER